MIYSYCNDGIISLLLTSDIDKVISQIQSYGIFAQAVFVGIVILEVIFAPVPPLILYVVAGVLYGGFYGGVLVLFGNLVGALIDFEIGRLFLYKVIDKRFDKIYRQI